MPSGQRLDKLTKRFRYEWLIYFVLFRPRTGIDEAAHSAGERPEQFMIKQRLKSNSTLEGALCRYTDDGLHYDWFHFVFFRLRTRTGFNEAARSAGERPGEPPAPRWKELSLQDGALNPGKSSDSNIQTTHDACISFPVYSNHALPNDT